MRLLKPFLLALLMAFPALAQIPAPPINLSNAIGAQGFPVLNNGILSMTDANRTMTAAETSAVGGFKVTGTWTANHTLTIPAGRFQFLSAGNGTTGGFSLILCSASGGLCLTIPNGQAATGVWVDGTNVTGALPSSGGAVSSLTTTGTGNASLSAGVLNVPPSCQASGGSNCPPVGSLPRDTVNNAQIVGQVGSGGDSTCPTPAAGKEMWCYFSAANRWEYSVNGGAYYIPDDKLAAGTNVTLDRSTTPGTTIVNSTSSGGASPAGSNALQASNSGGTALAVATPAVTVSALGSSSGLEGYGDSHQTGTGAYATVVGGVSKTALQNGEFYLLQPTFGGEFASYAMPGNTLMDLSQWEFSHLYNAGVGGPNYVIEIGTNDAGSTNGGTTNYQNSFKYVLQGAHLFATIPRANETFAQDSSVTTSGTWVAENLYQTGWGQSSTTNGSVINIPVTVGSDGHAVVWSRMIDSNGGTFTVNADSGANFTDPVGGSATFHSTGYGGTAIVSPYQTGQGQTGNAWAGYVFSGLSAGGHTIHVTVTSTTGAGNIVEIGGAAGLPGTNVNLPYVFASGVQYQNSGSGGASDTLTATYDTLVSGLVTAMQGLNLNDSFVDIRNALLNAPSCGNGVEATMFTNCYADDLHQNNAGHAVIAGQYVTVATAISANLTAGAIRNPRLGPSSRYAFAGYADPTKWWSADGSTQSAITNKYGAGYRWNQAGGGQNIVGIGNFGGTNGILIGGTPFNFAVCPRAFCPTPSLLTSLMNINPNGSICFFANSLTGCGGNMAYMTPAAIDLGGPIQGYDQIGVWLTHNQNNGVAGSAAASSGANANSLPFYWRGNCYNGETFPDDLGFVNVMGSGSTPTKTLTLVTQYGCGGPAGVDLTAATGGVKLPAGSTVGGAAIATGSSILRATFSLPTQAAGVCTNVDVTMTGLTNTMLISTSAKDNLDGGRITTGTKFNSTNLATVNVCTIDATASAHTFNVIAQ